MVFRIVGSATTQEPVHTFTRVVLAIGQPPLPRIQSVLSMDGCTKEISTSSLLSFFLKNK